MGALILTGFLRVGRPPPRHPRRSPTEHKDRVTGVAWSPLDEAVAPLHFASGSADGTVKLWAIDRCTFTHP